MKRLLLVRIYQEAPHPAYSQPLGIMYLASYLRERRPEVEVKLLDMRLTRMAPEGLRAEIAAFKPDCVGLSVLSFEAATLPACAAVVKDYDPTIAVVVGGPHASSDSETILKDENVDLCVIGEGEETLLELVDKGLGPEALGEIAGVAYRAQDGAYARNAARDYIEGVDDLPFPAWDMIDVLAYSDIQSMNNMLARSPYMAIFTSRACPYRCAYCHEVFGKTFRARSVENVIAEMRHVYDVYGVREFHIVDDIFNWDPDRAGAIMDAIVEAGMDVKIAFPNGVRADRMTPELVQKFARAGTYAMSVAVETASPRLQRVIEKHNDLDKVRQTINEAYKAGIIVKGFFMLGFPTETPEEIEATIDFAVKSRCLISGFFTVVPFPGSTLYDMAVKECPAWAGKGVDSHYYEEKPFYTLAYGADIRKIQRRALLRFYAQPWRLWALLTRIPRKRDLLRNARPLAELMFSFVSRLRGKKASGADYARSVEVANAF